MVMGIKRERLCAVSLASRSLELRPGPLVRPILVNRSSLYTSLRLPDSLAGQATGTEGESACRGQLMSDFFHSWRRKAGCVTLVMALVFMGGWVRSVSLTDNIVVPCERNRIHVLLSLDSTLGWWIYRADKPHGKPAWPDWRSEVTVDAGRLNNGNVQWNWRCCGFGRGATAIAADGSMAQLWTIPYWSVTTPLTLLSAFLLLSKPRKLTQKKLAEPIPFEGH